MYCDTGTEMHVQDCKSFEKCLHQGCMVGTCSSRIKIFIQAKILEVP